MGKSEVIISCATEIEVPFYDVDAMQIVWHGHYVKYMETARSRLLDLIDYNYQQMQQSGYAWPIVELHLKYVKPLKLKQIIMIEAELVEIDYGIKINFYFSDKTTGAKLTKAYSRQVAIDSQTGEMCLLSPAVLQQKLDAYFEGKNHA